MPFRVGVSIDAPLHSIDSLDPDPSCSDNSFDEEAAAQNGDGSLRKSRGVRVEGGCAACSVYVSSVDWQLFILVVVGAGSGSLVCVGVREVRVLT